MGHKEDNARKISNAFIRLLTKEKTACLLACRGLMEDAVQFSLDLHEIMELPVHENARHGYGWIILYGGVIADFEYYEGGIYKSGFGEGHIPAIFSEAPMWYDKSKGGYQCFVVADMSIPGLNWDHEVDVLEESAKRLSSEFDRVITATFKQVKY